MSNLVFQCRSCGNRDGKLVLDLGVQPLANNLLRPEDLALIPGCSRHPDGPLNRPPGTFSPAGGEGRDEGLRAKAGSTAKLDSPVFSKPEPRFPLRVFVCPHCWLLQITDLVPPVELFSDYLYFSSFSETMLRHAREAAQQHIRDFALGPQSQVIEIASNDGYLLKNFREAGVPCLGIEPAANIATVAREQGIETLVDFFTTGLAAKLARAGRQADLILGNNVFAHVPDINDFVTGLRTLLKPAGRIVLEFPYAVDMLEKSEFDTIYHEHVFYFTLTALAPLFERHGLEVVDVERLAIHGGSLRIYIRHVASQIGRATPGALSPAGKESNLPLTGPTGTLSHIGGEGVRFMERLPEGRLTGTEGFGSQPASKNTSPSPPQEERDGMSGQARVTTLLKQEHDKGVDSLARYEGFAAQVTGIRHDLQQLLLDLKGQGKTVAAYGASAKGSTLLNYCGLDHRQIAFVADRSPHKQGRFTPGTHIPIVGPEELLKRMPEYTLLLTWNFAEEILAQQQSYQEAGGRFIIPIPAVRVV